jgi:CBS-domain-containing membrane protein
MKEWRVDDVMTRDVVTVREETPYRDLVELLISRRVSAVPVVDRAGRARGMVSEADLLHKVEAAGGMAPGVFGAWRQRRDHAKANGRTAADVMTSPVVTAEPSLSLAAAARRMHREGVKRLPVVDARGCLAGIVSRSDLLKVHRRTDGEIRRDVVDEALSHVLASKGATVQVSCADGIVTLAGRVQLRSTAELIAALPRQVPGVVDVADRLTFDIDDRSPDGSEIGAPFGVW